MRNRTPTVLVALLVVALAACATVQPGQDVILVNAERDLKIAVGTIDNLFKVDYENWKVIDPLIPGWKAAVNALRVAAPPVIDAADGSIKAYRAALALYRVDPTQVTQEQLNALGNDLGTKIVAAVNLGKQAAAIIGQWKGSGT